MEDFGSQIVALLPRLRRFALALTHTEEDANDLVQAAVERALKHPRQIEADAPLDRWLFRVIKSIWFNLQRAEALRTADSIDHHENDLVCDGLRVAEAKITLAEVQDSFRLLPPEQREAMLLVCVEGYSYQAAAQHLGIPIGTLMSRLSRGRATLMAALFSPEDAQVRRLMSRRSKD